MELKTVKDLCDDDWYEEEDIYNIDANEVVDVTKEELKQEAIKWVKEKNTITHAFDADDFKEFHNITEEDLQ